MSPWMWRVIAAILAIAFLPLVVSGTASLVTSAIHGVAAGFQDLLRPFSMSGEARLEGIIRLCLFLIAITFLVQVLFKR